METEIFYARRRLAVLESVQCLECGNLYAKPVSGGTAAANPGCPTCGYVGWWPVNSSVAPQPHRYGEDHLRRRYA